MSKIKNTSKKEVRPDWLFGMNPEAIEAQEKRGQDELVEGTQLPAQSGRSEDTKDTYIKLGMAVLQDREDELFYKVKLPPGWKLKVIEHSMWSELLDDKGRVRAGIFYKAAFYDRSAYIRFQTRYQVHFDVFEDKYRYKVTDGDEILYVSNFYEDSSGDDKERAKCEKWLDTKYPDWRDVFAYWGDTKE